MKKVCVVALILATVCTGLMAGLSLAYAIAVMPGLEDTGDPTFVESFQQIDHALDNSVWFWVAIFVGSMVLIILSLVLAFRMHLRSVRTWLLVAAVLYAVTMAITGLGIDPLENDFGEAVDSSEVTDPSLVRAEVDEDRWMVLNTMRLLTNGAVIVCLSWSLVLFGRSSGHPTESESKRR